LILACRGINEEIVNGIINFICWPMMFLSEVWFSVEGSSDWIQNFVKAFLLTHFLSALRRIINDGATLFQVSSELMVLSVISLVCLSIGSFWFSWTK
jgi:ABC-2 type transport system permease protein